MTLGEFRTLLDDRIERDGLLGKSVVRTTVDSTNNAEADAYGGQRGWVHVDGAAYCKFILRSLPGCQYITDVEWLMPEPRELGAPCLTFKGINKFLRKREALP